MLLGKEPPKRLGEELGVEEIYRGQLTVVRRLERREINPVPGRYLRWFVGSSRRSRSGSLGGERAGGGGEGVMSAFTFLKLVSSRRTTKVSEALLSHRAPEPQGT